MRQTNKLEGTFAIVVALIVLFSAMLNTLVSIGISLVALISFAIWEFMKRWAKQLLEDILIIWKIILKSIGLKENYMVGDGFLLDGKDGS